MENKIVTYDMYYAAAVELFAKIVPENIEQVPDGRGGYKTQGTYLGTVPELDEIKVCWNGEELPFRTFVKHFINLKRDWIYRSDKVNGGRYE